MYSFLRRELWGPLSLAGQASCYVIHCRVSGGCHLGQVRYYSAQLLLWCGVWIRIDSAVLVQIRYASGMRPWAQDCGVALGLPTGTVVCSFLTSPTVSIFHVFFAVLLCFFQIFWRHLRYFLLGYLLDGLFTVLSVGCHGDYDEPSARGHERKRQEPG